MGKAAKKRGKWVKLSDGLDLEEEPSTTEPEAPQGHVKNARPSTAEKHEKGEERRKRDKSGGEKGDVRRKRQK